MYKVLFVCTGNICRSPTAEAIFRDMVIKRGLQDRVAYDSAGTTAYHVGEKADNRARALANKKGIKIDDLRSRQTDMDDFATFDLILAMDHTHQHALFGMRPANDDRFDRARLELFMDYAPAFGTKDVPDPYYGGPEGFENVFDMVKTGCAALLDDIEQNYLSENKNG